MIGIKRFAKVGENIKITNARFAKNCYKNGEMYLVEEIDDRGGIYFKTLKTHPCCTQCYKGYSYADSNEYVVLEIGDQKLDLSKATNEELLAEITKRMTK